MKKRKFETENPEIKTILRRTWCRIGNDIMTTFGEEEEPDIATIAILVLDANYMEANGVINQKDKELIQSFRKLTYKEQYRIAKEMYK